ncbi:MAG TPA: AzlD domain-containing protein [Ferrovibrio sp.]|jgi:uncharacterized membrane protein|uniref:AzlD family protein n=1 Tax=Ferrovibrio sp. TaxID=1917215 RepID=UPI002B4B9022|nr:AzlD domain-containing protein [Ferrovibrio sp.]HLT77331.1 AzlD domain-containing protein [Ferrovibrio sp.]
MSELLALDMTALAAVIGMAVATYVTRAGGFWLMGHITLTPRIERFLRNMANGVLIAIITAAAMRGDVAMWIGLAAVLAVMLLFRRSMTAILIGMAIAAALRQLLV